MSASRPPSLPRPQVFRTWDLVQTPASEQRKVRNLFNSIVYGGALCIAGGYFMTRRKPSGPKLMLIGIAGYGYLVYDLQASTRSVVTGLRIETDLRRVTISTGLMRSTARTFKIADLEVLSADESKTSFRGRDSKGEQVRMELPSESAMAASKMQCAEPALVSAIVAGNQAEVLQYRFSQEAASAGQRAGV